MQPTEGELPAAMSGSCGVCVDGVLYLFGGHHTNGNTNLVGFRNHLCNLQIWKIDLFILIDIVAI